MPKHRTDTTTAISDAEATELTRSLANELHTLKLPATDLHTRGLLRLMRQRYAEWNAAPPGPAAVHVPTAFGKLRKVDILPGIISVPIFDEDWGAAPLSKRALHQFLRSLPIRDDVTPWESQAEALRIIEAEIAPIEPLPTVEWTDKTSDQTIELMAWNGVGSHRLMPLDRDRDNAKYIVDLSWMHGFPVRDGFERYGAAAYFSESGKLLRIYTGQDDRHVYPGEEGWEDAKWRWKCSVLVGTTVADHLAGVHLTTANLMVTTTREHLPPDHPIRRLLKPHEFRTVAINYDASLALAPEGGIVHRAFALTYEGLVGCILHGTRMAGVTTFPMTMAQRQLADFDDRFPFATDGIALFQTIRKYVAEYASLFYGKGALAKDAAIRTWWQALNALGPSMGFGPLSEDAQVIDLLTQFIFDVAGYHEHVGGLAEYSFDPTFVSGKIRPGVRMSDVQSTVQLLMLVAATGFRQPPLLGDYTHLFLDRERRGAETAFWRYQSDLKALEAEIDQRNLERPRPFQSFNPTILQSSVSI